MAATLAAMVVLTALTVGLPALAILQQQQETQASRELAHGAAAARVLVLTAYPDLSQDGPPSSSGAEENLLREVLDNRLAAAVSEQTGLPIVFLLEGVPLAASPENLAVQIFLPLPPAQKSYSALPTLQIAGQPYAFYRSPLPRAGLEIMVLYPLQGFSAARRQMAEILASAILGLGLLGALLGVWRARQFIHPLEKLRDAAQALRSGDLYTPVAVHTRMREAAQVGFALEDARVALYHGLAQLRQEKEWSEHLLASVVEGIVTIDRRGRITYFSHGAERITGCKQEQVIGHAIDTVFRLAGEDIPFSRRIPSPGGMQKVTLQLPDGRQVTLAITGSRLAPPETGKAGVALVLRDVSDEEAIRKLLGDFLANITHEFRTPLAAQAASIEMLVDQLPDLSQAEVRELLGSVHLGVLSLQTLIDNLLEGASIETGQFRVSAHPADLEEILSNAATVIRPLAEKYRQHVRLEYPDEIPSVQVDARRTGQVLVNLLSNAIKWGPSNGEIRISVVTLPGSFVQVSVADQGPGLPDSGQDELFQRFTHLLVDSGRAGHGAGLGLSVVKAIVEAQGGQVGARNHPEGGAIFWFTVPVI